jgi:hypothetical protein
MDASLETVFSAGALSGCCARESGTTPEKFLVRLFDSVTVS